MNPNRTPFRAFGQRSISLFSCSFNSARDSKGNVSNKGSRESLSDFLDRKLHRTSTSPKIVQEKSRPFSSLVVPKEVGYSVNGQTVENGEETENSSVLRKDAFKLFKHTNTEKLDPGGLDNVSGEETPSAHEGQNSRKRRDSFEVGADKEPIRRKPYLVLGVDTESRRDDPRPKRIRTECYSRTKKSKPHYNHYANGSGWWDGDMEGVDSEEVGYSEVWEGVGSSTFGDIVDWH